MAQAAGALKAQQASRKSPAQTVKTQQQRQELPRITGEGWRQIIHKGPALRCFFVESRSIAGMEYPVFVCADGRLSCSCISSYYRGTCAHKTAVAAALAEEAAQVARAQEQAEAAAECGWCLTAKGRRALEAWRNAQAREQEQAERAEAGAIERATRETDVGAQRSPRARRATRETLLNRTRPFSLLA